MHTTDIILVAILAIYFLGVIPVDVILMRRAAARVRQYHPDTWAALNVTSPHSIAFVRFVRTKGYLALNDAKLSEILTFKRRFDVITALVFIAAVGLVVAWQRRS